MTHGKRQRWIEWSLLLVTSLVVALTVATPGQEANAIEVSPSTKMRVQDVYGKLPLSFEANRGQADSQVKFLARGRDYQLYMTSTEAVLVLKHPEARLEPGQSPPEVPEQTKAAVLRMKLASGNPTPEVTGLDELPGKSNYFIGSDPQKWRVNVPTYGRVEYREVYPGINLVYYGNQRRIEYDFVIAPGADPSMIALEFHGAEKIELDARGNLVLRTAAGDVIQRTPRIYQAVDGGERLVSGGYMLRGKDRVGFRVAAYDISKPLIIDPVLTYSTYLGGSDQDESRDIAIDASGNAYIAGFTASLNFPTASPLQAASAGGFDVFVTKINAAGSALVHSTYLGGSSDDYGRGVAIDASGNVYVTGLTLSTNFPIVSAFQPAFGGLFDAFVAKLNANGSALVYSTYLGGSDGDDGFSIAVDSSGNAYLTGRTFSTNFPTANPFQPAYGGGVAYVYDAFVTKLNAAGNGLVYSTYLGGNGDDGGYGIAVDASSSAYVTGYTESPNFPTANPLQAASGGLLDAFVTKLNAAGSALVYSTYLGGGGTDGGQDIAVDASGNAYVAGYTGSSNFPTANPLQPFFGGGYDAFVTKLNAAGSALVYSTYLGGSGYDVAGRIAVDGAGNTYVTGQTNSTNFPTANPIQAASGGNYDAFVTKLNAAGSELLYSTYLGGSMDDGGMSIAVDSTGAAYVAGRTASTDFPTANPLQGTFGGVGDAFVAKISHPLCN